MGYSIWYPVIARIAGAMGHVARKMVFSMRAQVGFRSGLWNKKITNHNKKITLVGTHTHMYTSIYTRKTAVSPSPKLSFVTFEFCSSCRRNAFFPFLSAKKCILICGHQWIWARPFCVAGAVFSDLTKKSRMAFSLAGAGLFAFLARSGWSFFLSCLWRCFLSLGGAGGGGGWGWGHDNVLSFPSSLRFMLTRQWCYALDFLRCYVNTSVMWRSWLSLLLC